MYCIVTHQLARVLLKKIQIGGELSGFYRIKRLNHVVNPILKEFP